MSTALELITDNGITDPETGEVVPLDKATSVVIAKVLGEIQHEIEQRLFLLGNVKRVLGAALIERMDKGGEWTVTAPGVKISAPSPAAGRVSWDAEVLEAILDKAISDGLIDADAKRRAVKQTFSLVPVAKGIANLQKIPEMAARMESAKTVHEAGPRSVTIKPTPRTS